MTPQDVVSSHLYLTDITDFRILNVYYERFFGTVLPPSRSCVGTGVGVNDWGAKVSLDIIAQKGSGMYNRGGDEGVFEHYRLRETLHVQGISTWAPVCVGPYSQSNTLRGSLTIVAGLVGLVPESMKIVEGGWKVQLGDDGNVKVGCKVRFVRGCLGAVWCDVSAARGEGDEDDGPTKAVFKAMSAVGEAVKRANIRMGNLLNVRVYMVGGNEGRWKVRDVEAAVRMVRRGLGLRFAVCVVPVLGLGGGKDLMVQAMACDLAHAETEMWLKTGRE
ncbi:hypothetical protein TrCOL_g628 [Triparma columacea]|nr:hypothetical protein TrCOL_g628 [Triparma columacea]